jgi:hypothetical protein
MVNPFVSSCCELPLPPPTTDARASLLAKACSGAVAYAISSGLSVAIIKQYWGSSETFGEALGDEYARERLRACVGLLELLLPPATLAAPLLFPLIFSS